MSFWSLIVILSFRQCTQIAKFIGPAWGPHGSYRPQMDPMLAPWILLSGWLPFLLHPVTKMPSIRLVSCYTGPCYIPRIFCVPINIEFCKRLACVSSFIWIVQRSRNCWKFYMSWLLVTVPFEVLKFGSHGNMSHVLQQRKRSANRQVSCDEQVFFTWAWYVWKMIYLHGKRLWPCKALETFEDLYENLMLIDRIGYITICYLGGLAAIRYKFHWSSKYFTRSCQPF